MTAMREALLKAKLITADDVKKASKTNKQPGKLCPKCKFQMYKIHDRWSCSNCSHTLL